MRAVVAGAAATGRAAGPRSRCRTWRWRRTTSRPRSGPTPRLWRPRSTSPSRCRTTPGSTASTPTTTGRSRAGQAGQPQPQYAAHDPYAAPAPAAYGAEGQDPYAGQDPLAGQYDYGTERQQYAAYSDPYIGTGTTGGPAQYDAYDSHGNGYDSFGGRQQYDADPYAQQYAPETPPGGVWVPQQREGEQYPVAPPEPPARPAPHPNGYNNGNGYDEQQYRY